METVSRDELATLQLGRLREVVRRRGIDARVDSLDDLRDLPFTTKEDLRAHYPLGMMVVSHDRLVRLHSSSGTSGKPTIVGHTFGDLDVWADIMARSLAAAGVGRGTMLHNAYGYGLTTGGFGFQQGAELLGATVVPAAGASLDLQMQLLHDLRTQVLCCTPSFAVQIAGGGAGGRGRARARRSGSSAARCGPRRCATAWRRTSASPRSTPTGSARSSARASPRSASSATTARTSTRTTSSSRSSTPSTDRPVAPARWASSSSRRSPARRCRSSATARTTSPRSASSPVSAGAPPPGWRPSWAAAATSSRPADARFFPSQVETVLVEDPAVALDYQLVLDAERVTVHCEPLDAATDHAALAARLRAAMRTALGTDVAIVVETPGTEPRTPGKAVRVLDERDTERMHAVADPFAALTDEERGLLRKGRARTGSSP